MQNMINKNLNTCTHNNWIKSEKSFVYYIKG